VNVVVAGPDADGIAPALEAAGASVARLTGAITAEALRGAGLPDAAVYVLTDMDEATSIPIAREVAPDCRIVTYARRSLPDFAAAVTDLAVDPALLSPATVAAELTAE